ncbi:hypothetical protein BSF41_23260 [Flavobacterium sp. ACN2]|jgi:hypothetical protein|nr:hypothetical protein BSF41_23260 [Flavobacterium sp. ACN2]
MNLEKLQNKRSLEIEEDNDNKVKKASRFGSLFKLSYFLINVWLNDPSTV